MGVQPGLDGLRAISVVAVIAYHAGFEWIGGGFLGVEVFFVVSGFLITTLLIEERDRAGRVSLRGFWTRRARRLLPALGVMLLAVVIVVLVWGGAQQQSQLRRDLPWSLGYVANWGQILSDAPYFAPSPAALRHLWSLAVEEQWYLVWPLLFLVIGRRARHDRRIGVAVGVAGVLVMAATAAASIAQWPQRWFDPFRGGLRTVDTTNFLYLSTPTRSSGLLLGAGLAFLWRPWQKPNSAPQPRRLDGVAAAAVAMLAVAFVAARVTSPHTYRYWLPVTSLLAAALVGVVVHPSARVSRRLLGAKPLVAIGQRSYGLYLWSWPISLGLGAYEGSWSRFALAMIVTVPVSEACYRWIETPIRRGALGAWLAAASGRRRTAWRVGGAAAAVAMLFTTTIALARVEPRFDAAKDTSSAEVFDLESTGLGAPSPQTTSTPTVTSTIAEASAATTAEAADTTDAPQRTTTTPPPPPSTLPPLPRRMVIVGDSTAHSLAVNLPAGLDDYFRIEDGSIDGCSVYSDGVAASGKSFRRPFKGCAGWEERWLRDAQRIDAELALVVLGAWDVLDVRFDDRTVTFASQEFDDRFSRGVQTGIDVLASAGVHVALLEIPCMRPREARGAGTPPLPERADDIRVQHLNQLLRNLAAVNPDTTTYVPGPPEYCTDETISGDPKYRWDGVHASGKGVNLTFSAIALPLLQIELDERGFRL
jgi:peptidoglycan/LPS O-acetylase OafA/YrhL